MSIFCVTPTIPRSSSEKRIVPLQKRWKRMTIFHRPSRTFSASSTMLAATGADSYLPFGEYPTFMYAPDFMVSSCDAGSLPDIRGMRTNLPAEEPIVIGSRLAAWSKRSLARFQEGGLDIMDEFTITRRTPFVAGALGAVAAA